MKSLSPESKYDDVGGASMRHSLSWPDPQVQPWVGGTARLQKAYLGFWAVAVVGTPKCIREVLQNSLGDGDRVSPGEATRMF